MEPERSDESPTQKEHQPSLSASVSASANSSGDSEWKSSATKAKGKTMRVGQGLGKKLKLIKVPSAVKAVKRPTSKKIKKQRRKKSKQILKKQFTFEEPSQFHCDECNEDFGTGQALGGHMSRVHPGKSESYAKKVERRKERAFDRELLRLAKIKHSRDLGENAPLDRVKIRRFKKTIKAAIHNGERVEGWNGPIEIDD